VLATWLLALPVSWLFPVAPPRLAGLGIADTITQQTGLALDSKLTTSFYNPLAAVPSLHCGFALAVSLALPGSARRWTRALALAWAPTIFLAVVATGNHVVFDIAAGITATGLGFGVARLVAGRGPAGQVPGTADRRAARARSRRWSPWMTSDASPPSSAGSWTSCRPSSEQAAPGWLSGTAGTPRRHAVRRERLERYVDALTPAQRLRLAGALHLLSPRLDEDLAHPDQRAA